MKATIEHIREAYDSAVAVYRKDGGDYNAGRVDEVAREAYREYVKE